MGGLIRAIAAGLEAKVRGAERATWVGKAVFQSRKLQMNVVVLWAGKNQRQSPKR